MHSSIINVESFAVWTGMVIFISPVTPVDLGLVIPPKELKS
jgi:hypothetical protein